jgi:hypothetical protein
VIGLSGEQLVQHYYDSRGEARDYALSIDGRSMRLERIVPGFSQRYDAEVSADGRTIAGAWQLSDDGTDWRHDFNLTYYRS